MERPDGGSVRHPREVMLNGYVCANGGAALVDAASG